MAPYLQAPALRLSHLDDRSASDQPVSSRRPDGLRRHDRGWPPLEAARHDVRPLRPRHGTAPDGRLPQSAATTLHLEARELSRSAKIGAPIGIILGCLLLVLILYPFVIRFINRRRSRHDSDGGLPITDDAFGHPGPGLAGTSSTLPVAQVDDTKKERRMSATEHPRRVRTFETGKDVDMTAYHPGQDATAAQSGPDTQPGHWPSPAAPQPADAQPAECEPPFGPLGHSASYYSREIDVADFGVDISSGSWDAPDTAEAAAKRQSSGWSGPTRTSTRMSVSSIWESLVRRTRSEKGSLSSPSTVVGPIATTPTGPAAPITSEPMSESPTGLAPEPNALSRTPEERRSQSQQPRAKSQSPPAAAAIHFQPPSSPPVPPPADPAPGTVNPMAVMAATTSTEHKWRVENELADLAHSAAGSPPNTHMNSDEEGDASPNAYTVAQLYPEPRAEERYAETGPAAGLPFQGQDDGHYEQQHVQQYVQQPQQPQPQQQQLYQPPLQTQIPQQMEQLYQTGAPVHTQLAAHQDHGHPVGTLPEVFIKPEPDMAQAGAFHHDPNGVAAGGVHGHTGSVELYPTDTDASTPLNNFPSPSGPSSLNTPNTQLTGDSPSPRPYGNTGFNSPMAANVKAESAEPTSPLVCDQCHRTFDMPHKLNHHKRYHQRPHVCETDGCGKRFGTKTHLDRHINDKHHQTKKFYCTVPTCAYSRRGNKSFPRKDNLRRHMANIHGVDSNANNIVDETMTG